MKGLNVNFRQNKLTRMKSSLFVMLRKMQFAPNAFLNSLWTFSLEQLQKKRKMLSVEYSLRRET